MRGLVVGKFAPLHLGHELVIGRASAECDEVVLLSYCDPEPEGCTAARREHWLRTRFPKARVLVGDRARWPDLPPDAASAAAHRHFVQRLLAEASLPVDVVYTSEAYGEGFAAVLGARHVLVDPERRRVPISGTAIRSDVHAKRAFLATEVYASFVRRVAILGGESSGKTTLAQALAERHETLWASEYGRELWALRGGQLDPADHLLIAERQIAREEELAGRAHRLLFCDTTPLTTLFYAQHAFGRAEDRLVELATRSYDLTVLCAPDFPFVQDGTRLDPTLRERQHAWYLRELANRGIAFTLVAGPVEGRVEAIGEMLRR